MKFLSLLVPAPIKLVNLNKNLLQYIANYMLYLLNDVYNIALLSTEIQNINLNNL